MAQRLQWHPATSRDAEAVAGFRCTDVVVPSGTITTRTADMTLTVTNMRPPGHYEVEAESLIQATPIPPPGGTRVLVGYDRSGLGAVAVWKKTGPAMYHAIVCGVRTDLRGMGIGDELVNAVWEELSRGLPVDCARVVITTKTHMDNRPSEAMLRRQGFTTYDTEGDYIKWAREIRVEPGG